MRALLTTAIYPPDIGGPASYVPKIADELARRGHAITVLTLADGESEEQREYGRLVRVDRRRGVLTRKLAALRMIARESAEVDLIYVNGLYEEALPILLRAKCPVVAKVVGDWAWERMRVRGLYSDTIDKFQTDPDVGLWGRLARSLRTLSMKPFSDVIVPSNYLRGIVDKWNLNGCRIHVIHNGVQVPEAYLSFILPEQTRAGP